MKMNPAALSAFAKGDMENVIVASTPGGIEAQEKAGQSALVNSTDMPSEMRPSREAFESLGFTFGEPVDELFLSATLPAGWSRKATDHSMHSVILDDRGRERVSIFYKAAFYDRRADAFLKHRYQVLPIYGNDSNGLSKEEMVYAIFDSGQEKARFLTFKVDDYSTYTEQQQKAYDALKQQFPDSDDPLAYWTDA